jgi:hypothetical protein
VNGVEMMLPELVESLSLIGGEFALSQKEGSNAPAAVLLRAAFGASAGRGRVTLSLHSGAAGDAAALVVSQS